MTDHWSPESDYQHSLHGKICGPLFHFTVCSFLEYRRYCGRCNLKQCVVRTRSFILMTRTGLWLCLIVMFPLCTAGSLETGLKYGATQSWRVEPMLEWNGSYDTLNKYDNEVDTTDCLEGYLCYVERTEGRLEVNNTATVEQQPEWKVVYGSTYGNRDGMCYNVACVCVCMCVIVLVALASICLRVGMWCWCVYSMKNVKYQK